MADETVDPDLLDAAEAVADARPLDERAGEAGPPDPTLEQLRVLATIATVHRESRGDAGGPAPDDGPRGVFEWGPLRALEKLGDGSFGEVWRAWDPALRREVALKLRREGAPARLTREWLDEGLKLARVRHPHVVTVYGAAVHDGRPGLWMERIRGVSLEDWIARHGRMGAREAAALGIELCAALAAVHAAGLAHGDVTTSNVMRETEGEAPGRLVLMDFGSAHAFLEGGGTIGTPLATAPEILRGLPVTPRLDLYSAGVLLFRLVTGRYPVEATSFPELEAKIARGERASLRALRPDLPPAFVAVVERAMEPDPEARFADAAEMERALTATLTGPSSGRPRLPLGGALGAIALMALAAGVALTFQHRRGPAHTAPRATAPPTAAVPAPPKAPAPLEAQATFYRKGAGGPEALPTGAALHPGDRLFLDLSVREPVYAYVLDEDHAGKVFVLFPVPGVDRTNPVPAGTGLRLPGNHAGRPQEWKVTSAGGRERLLTIVSRAPLPEVEQRLAALAHVERGGPAAGAAAAGPARLRGIGALEDEDPEAAPPGGTLEGLARSLDRRHSPDVWVRSLELRSVRR